MFISFIRKRVVSIIINCQVNESKRRHWILDKELLKDFIVVARIYLIKRRRRVQGRKN